MRIMESGKALVLVAACLMAGTAFGQGGTFFRPQPITQNLVLQNAMNAYQNYFKEFEKTKKIVTCCDCGCRYMVRIKKKDEKKAGVAEKKKGKKEKLSCCTCMAKAEALNLSTYETSHNTEARVESLHAEIKKEDHASCQQEKHEEPKKKEEKPKTPWVFAPQLYYYHGTGARSIARYFMPGGKATIVVAQNNTSDISSPWLKILTEPITPFEEIVCTEPVTDTIGGSFNLRYDFGEQHVCCFKFYPWVNLFTSASYVRNRIKFREKLLSPPGLAPGFPDVFSALNNPEWNFGKVPCRPQSSVGLDDIQLQLGVDLYRSPYFNIGTYGAFFIPTGTRSKACNLWEPTHGAGPHIGLGAGLFGNVITESGFAFLAEFRYLYFLRGRERRSIDLVNGDWSRYLLVALVSDLEARPPICNALPGINFFTRDVNVTPRGTGYLWLASHYAGDMWDVEIGYGLWWRQAEIVTLIQCPSGPEVAIFDITGRIPPGKTSASTATIKAALPGRLGPKSDPVVIPVKCPDLNTCSAAHPKAASSTIYGTTAFGLPCTCFEGKIGVGISYTFAMNRAANSQLGVWGTTGIAF